MTADATHGLPDRFRVLETLIEDEVEIVVRARDTLLEREVLLKRPGPALAQELGASDERERTLREARALASVRHSGVIRLLDVVDCAGGPVLVIEPIAGQVLADRVAAEGVALEGSEKGQLEPREVARLGRDLAGALEAVHAAGVVHRGLALDKIVLRADGSACLTGFRFAKFSSTDAAVTSLAYGAGADGPDSGPRAGRPTALPEYPAPEQLAGHVADPRADQFGLGCVLYRCLAGRDAFPSLHEHGWSPPTDPRTHASSVPRALAGIVTKCLARSPLGRFEDCSELRAALDRVAVGRSTGTSSRARLVAGAALFVVFAAWGTRLATTFAGDRGVRQPATPESVPDPASHGYGVGYAKRRALVIGIGEAYAASGHHPLENSRGDAEALGARLEKLGWLVTPLYDEQATQRAIVEGLVQLSADAKEEDQVLVYFAGHGERHEHTDDTGWLVPAGCPPNTEVDGVPFTRFEDFFRKLTAKHALVMMDCCFGARVAALRGPPRPSAGRDTTRKAHLVLTAGLASEQVSDGLGGHSPFAEVLLDRLNSLSVNEPAFNAQELIVALQAYMREHGIDQKPQLVRRAGADEGDYVFLREPSE